MGVPKPWGVKVTAVEVKDVDLPERMQRTMARQARGRASSAAQGDRRQGGAQAAQRLRQAAEIMTPYPMALQMRVACKHQLGEVACGEQFQRLCSPLALGLAPATVP